MRRSSYNRRGNLGPAKIGQPVLQPGTIRSALDTVWTVWAGYDCLYPPSGHQRTPQHRDQSPAGGRQGREPGASFLYHFLLSQQQTRVTNIRINHTTNPKPKLSTAIQSAILMPGFGLLTTGGLSFSGAVAKCKRVF